MWIKSIYRNNCFCCLKKIVFHKDLQRKNVEVHGEFLQLELDKQHYKRVFLSVDHYSKLLIYPPLTGGIIATTSPSFKIKISFAYTSFTAIA